MLRPWQRYNVYNLIRIAVLRVFKLEQSRPHGLLIYKCKFYVLCFGLYHGSESKFKLLIIFKKYNCGSITQTSQTMFWQISLIEASERPTFSLILISIAYFFPRPDYHSNISMNRNSNSGVPLFHKVQNSVICRGD